MMTVNMRFILNSYQKSDCSLFYKYAYFLCPFWFFNFSAVVWHRLSRWRSFSLETVPSSVPVKIFSFNYKEKIRCAVE